MAGFSHGLAAAKHDAQALEDNLSIDLSPIGIDLGNYFSDSLQDLVCLAATVYGADLLVSRGEADSVYGQSWRREFSFTVGANAPGLWAPFADDLSRLLGFLTEDSYRFEFEQAPPHPPLALNYGPSGGMSGADCVCLFSGGLDSLAGLVQLVCSGRKPVVVSHYSVPKRAKYVPELLFKLQSRLGTTFPRTHAQVQLKGLRAREPTQRSRSFLYLCIGVAVAKALSIEDVFIYDNGVVSMNLPKARSVYGAHASRSTHPRFLSSFQSIVGEILGGVRVHNPFLWMTKGEVLSILRENSVSDLIKDSISCGNTRNSSGEHPHCGVCSQCVDRRFAVSAMCLLEEDPEALYAKDIFCDDLSPGIEKSHAVQHWCFAKGVLQMGQERFYEEYPEAMEVLEALPGSPDAVDQVYDLMIRHSREVKEGLRVQFNRHFDRYSSGRLPDTCMLKMAGSSFDLVQELKELAVFIVPTLQTGLRAAFAERRPGNEREVQNEINALLLAMHADFSREFPHLQYSLVQNVPDFSLNGSDLVLEAKFVGDRKGLTSVTTHMNDQAVKYNQAGRLVCFLVWDEARIIPDDAEFAAPFLELPGVVHVAVLR